MAETAKTLEQALAAPTEVLAMVMLAVSWRETKRGFWQGRDLRSG